MTADVRFIVLIICIVRTPEINLRVISIIGIFTVAASMQIVRVLQYVVIHFDSATVRLIRMLQSSANGCGAHFQLANVPNYCVVNHRGDKTLVS